MTIHTIQDGYEKLTDKFQQKVSSNGRIVIPKEWRDKLEIDDSSEVEMELDDDKKIIIKKVRHPLEIEDNLFGDMEPFTEEELRDAKKSLFRDVE
ncbi:MAG: AbrB/MazE/SpoVT family DNA-binding domain-containing protein [Promethearchaeota archaeon]|nr:MAG: AbrB/MazE/SpoVT family DNA-binding domain-containing protein [Candidatus Lokiarchaeota archaeon]